MSATQIVQRLLMADPGVAAYASDRVYPGRIPQEAEVPNIMVSLVSEEQDIDLSGHKDGYESRVTIACHAEHYAIADAMGEEVKACLAQAIHLPVYGDESPPNLIATVTAWKTTTDLIDHDDERTLFRRIMDFRIRWVKP